MRSLSSIDVFIVVLYIVGTTLLGLWCTRGQRDLRTYFVGDRNVSWWLVLISIVATETSTVTFLSVPGMAFNPHGGNLTFLQLSLGYIVGRMLIAWWLLPQYLRGELFSAYQLLRERFSPAVQRTASGIFLLTRMIADGLRLYLAGLLIEQFTGWSIEASVLALGATTILYTYFGGMQAVIWTDMIQFTVYILGALFAGYMIVSFLPGGWSELWNVGGQAGKLKLFDLSTDPTVPYTLWAGLLGGAFLSMASHGADQMMVQRYLCARSLKQARFALVASGFVVLLQFTLFLFIGVGLFVLFHQGGLAVDLATTKNDAVFGVFIVDYLPRGLVGLVIAAVLASAMGTLASSLNSASSAFVADFYKPLRLERSEKHYLNVSRFMTLFWGLGRIGVALAALQLGSQRSIIDQVLAVAGFTTGIVLGLFVLGSLKHPVASASAFFGLIVGFVAVLCAWQLPPLWGKPALAWPWFAPIGSIVTVVVALSVDRLRRSYGSSPHGSPQPCLDQPG
ncbi:MAG TPA: sodium:solute symporter [Gemmataceae bacterium]|nr:sodium:solute symporter [Gemmataceae bacterium]